MALPSQIYPHKLALQGTLLEGSVNSSDLKRLKSAVNRIGSPLEASIQFETDESGRQFAKGTGSVKVELICQRCLNLLSINLEANFALQIVWSESQIANIVSNHEHWLVTDETADLTLMIEDEILLALPIVSYHNIGDCTDDVLEQKGADLTAVAAANNPFSILEQLKK